MKRFIKLIWHLTVVSAMAITTANGQEQLSGLSTDAGDAVEGFIEIPGDTETLEQENPEHWLESALLRYRNLEEQTKDLESEWLEEFNARLARLKTRITKQPIPKKATDKASKPTKDATVKLVSATASTLPTAAERAAEAPKGKPNRSKMPGRSATQVALEQLCDRVLNLEDRVTELERKNNLQPLSVSLSSSACETSATQEMKR